MAPMKEKYALLSVTDKTNIVAFARALRKLGFTLISTGGTGRVLRKAHVPFMSIRKYTGFPECMGGRLKTLHPKIEGGILADRGKRSHMRAARKLGINMIDLVCCNLYNFAGTIAKPGITIEEATEQIDVGGPTMIRAAAKNAAYVMVVIDPADYSDVIICLSESDAVQEMLRRKMQAKVFALTGAYDTSIGEFLAA